MTRIIERDPAGMNAEEIEAEARAWIDREKLRQKLRGYGGRGKDNPPQFHNDSSTDERAVAMLVAHPEWSNQQIAAAIPCHPKTLNKKTW